MNWNCPHSLNSWMSWDGWKCWNGRNCLRFPCRLSPSNCPNCPDWTCSKSFSMNWNGWNCFSHLPRNSLLLRLLYPTCYLLGLLFCALIISLNAFFVTEDSIILYNQNLILTDAIQSADNVGALNKCLIPIA